eukprot:COSAG06_NODE_51366_length_312_cov_1.671362_2_plen_26_part_01
MFSALQTFLSHGVELDVTFPAYRTFF